MATKPSVGSASGAKAPRAASPAKKPKIGAPKVADQPIPPRAKRGDPKIPGTTQYAADPLVDPKYTPVTPMVLEAFYHLLAQTGKMTEVCDHLRISKIYMLDLKRRDSEVARRWSEAMDVVYEGWEEEVARRAFKGYQRPVFQGGLLVGETTEYSDKLAEMLIKAGRPEKYVPRVVQTIEHSGEIGAKLASLPNDELNKRLHESMRMLAILEEAKTGPKTGSTKEPGDADGA